MGGDSFAVIRCAVVLFFIPYTILQPTPPPRPGSPQTGIIPPWGGVNFQPRHQPPPPGLNPLRPPPTPRGNFEFVAAPIDPEDLDLPSRSVGFTTCFRPFVTALNPDKLTFLDLINAVDGGPKDEGAAAVEYTLNQGVDPNSMPYDLATGESILLHAVFCNKPQIVKLLLEYGADPNRVRASDKMSPLHYAAWHDSVPMMKALLAKGGNLTMKDARGHTVFQRALCMNSLNVAKFVADTLGAQPCGGRREVWLPGNSDYAQQDMCYRIHRYYQHDIHG